MILRQLPIAGLVLAAALACANVGAQQPAAPAAPAPGAGAPPPPQQPMTAKEAKAKFAERFKAADANHDGKLTREEAQAGMPDVYEHFDQIDRKKRGYVTRRQIGQWWALQTKEQAKRKDPGSLN